MTFEPDACHMIDVLRNVRPARLPIYEHIISPQIMERVLGLPFAHLENSTGADLNEFFAHYDDFWRQMTYDTVSFEVTVSDQLPDHGAIFGGRPGTIQNRADFERYPWADLPRIYWEAAAPKFDAMVRHLPPGMLALGGIGNGVFELAEDLVGFQHLAYMMADDPELFADLYVAIGNLLENLWTTFLAHYGEHYAICRFGDDLGFKTSTLVSPVVIRAHVIPQYRRLIGLIRASGKPFLWHSCGKIFTIMDDVIALGIQAKHSNEDIIAPFDEWIRRYNDRIGLMGGIDVDLLCQCPPQVVFETVVEKGRRFRALARGYALGSGNSIPEYVPVEGYLAMIRAAQHIRELEASGA